MAGHCRQTFADDNHSRSSPSDAKAMEPARAASQIVFNPDVTFIHRVDGDSQPVKAAISCVTQLCLSLIIGEVRLVL